MLHDNTDSPDEAHLTTIQIRTDTRDRLFRLKFRKTYDAFLQELCDVYEKARP